MEASSSYESTL
jgi:hypothetical protein